MTRNRRGLDTFLETLELFVGCKYVQMTTTLGVSSLELFLTFCPSESNKVLNENRNYVHSAQRSLEIYLRPYIQSNMN